VTETEPIKFDWEQKSYHGVPWWTATIGHQGIHVHVTVKYASEFPGSCPCHPKACSRPGSPVVTVTASAYVDGVAQSPLTLGEASCDLHVSPAFAGPDAEGTPGNGPRASSAREVADRAADQVTDAVSDALDNLSVLGRHARRLGLIEGEPEASRG
jgi:hypothetical protein